MAHPNIGTDTPAPSSRPRNSTTPRDLPLKTATATNKSAATRLKLEADSMAMFDHPGIPKLLDQGANANGDPYIVMSTAPGESLRNRLERWKLKNRTHGDVEASQIVLGLLSAVCHIHSRGQVHRDIKDANTLFDAASDLTSVIDFGFCKPIGQSAMRDDDSFFRVGAARFSPPAKLLDPSLAVAAHDIFAVGVIAYLLSTGRYPWSVPGDRDFGALRSQMLSAPLQQIHHLNSLADVEYSRFVSKLLVIDDDLRPTAAAAVEELSSIIGTMTRSLESRSSTSIIRLTYPYVIRDQIYGDVRLTDLEFSAVNTKEMQRLRWIKQLGLTNFVYPGAEHSRLSHSIGTLQRSELMLRAVEDATGTRVDPDTRSQIRLYALTHDVSHVAAGHTVEDQLGIFERHDQNAARFDRLVESGESDLGGVLRANEIGRSVIRYLDPTGDVDRTNIIEQAVSGPLGADVLDYIDRDAYNCGLDHRVDSAIYRQLRLVSKDPMSPPRIETRIDGKYGLRVDWQYAVENLLFERYALFLKVYAHSAKIAADAMLGKALSLLKPKESDYEWMGDERILDMLMRSRRGKELVQELGQRLHNRVLPRGVLRAPVFGHGSVEDVSVNDEISRLSGLGYLDPRGRAEIERSIAKAAGINDSRVFFYCPKYPPGYKRTVLPIDPSEQVYSRSISQARAIEKRHLGLWSIWVFVNDADDDLRARVARVSEEILQSPNVIGQYRRPVLDLEYSNGNDTL